MDNYPQATALFANAFHPLRERVLRRYRQSPPSIRFYAWYRWCVSPFSEVVEIIPPSGLVVDMGCGFGLLANSIRERHPATQVLGIDIDERRINYARQSALNDNLLSFMACDWFTLPNRNVSAFVFMDVLHHLSAKMQHEVLEFCALRLAVGGSIIIKDVDTSPYWKYSCNWIFDHATSLLGVTRGMAFTYLSSEQWAQTGSQLGLTPQHLPLTHKDYAPHFLLKLTQNRL